MKIRKLFFVSIVLTSCTFVQKEEPKYEDAVIDIPVEHEYDEISEFELLRENMFDVESDHYYVYFYSLSCNHCAEIKNYMIEKAVERKDIYFIKGTSKDKITNDEKMLINAENPENFYILGYPTLALISEKKCTKNLAGISKIKQELK